MSDIAQTTCQTTTDSQGVDCNQRDVLLKINSVDRLKINSVDYLIIRRVAWDEIDPTSCNDEKEIIQSNCQ